MRSMEKGIAAGVVLLLVAGCQTTGSSAQGAGGAANSTASTMTPAHEVVPLPDDATVTPPDSSVPAGMAAFSGTWSGRWNGNELPHVLVVQRVEPSGAARIVYAYSAYSPWNISKPQAWRHVAQIDGPKLKATLGNGAEVTYWREGEKLKGEYLRDGRITPITMEQFS